MSAKNLEYKSHTFLPQNAVTAISIRWLAATTSCPVSGCAALAHQKLLPLQQYYVDTVISESTPILRLQIPYSTFQYIKRYCKVLIDSEVTREANPDSVLPET